MSDFPQGRQSDLIVQELEKELLIYDLKADKMFCFNEMSAFIWSLCDGSRQVDEIRKLVNKRLKTEISEDYVWLALDQFHQNNLLKNNENFAAQFRGLNRRQVIKKIGLASMVVLPLVSSLVAPRAAAAASGGLAFRAACTTSPQCASGNCVNNTCCNAGATGSFPANQLVNCSNTVDGCSAFAPQCCSNSTFASAAAVNSACQRNGFAFSCFCN